MTAAERIFADSEQTLDVRHGPILSVDMAEITGERIVHFAAHHAVVDLVSWRVILDDMEAFLSNGKLRTVRANTMSFWRWCHLQAEHARHTKALLSYY